MGVPGAFLSELDGIFAVNEEQMKLKVLGGFFEENVFAFTHDSLCKEIYLNIVVDHRLPRDSDPQLMSPLTLVGLTGSKNIFDCPH